MSDLFDDIPRHRDTSIVSFYNSVASGLITKRSQQVWACLSDGGRGTQNEVIVRVQKQYPAKGQSLRPRFAELRDAGLIREVGERVCSLTKKMCIVWEAVPLEEWTDPGTLKKRCELCGQIIKRTHPKRKPSA